MDYAEEQKETNGDTVAMRVMRGTTVDRLTRDKRAHSIAFEARLLVADGGPSVGGRLLESRVAGEENKIQGSSRTVALLGDD